MWYNRTWLFWYCLVVLYVCLFCLLWQNIAWVWVYCRCVSRMEFFWCLRVRQYSAVLHMCICLPFPLFLAVNTISQTIVEKAPCMLFIRRIMKTVWVPMHTYMKGIGTDMSNRRCRCKFKSTETFIYMGIATYNFVYPTLLIGPVVLLVLITKIIETRMWNMISSPATPTVCLEQKSENFQSRNVTLSMPPQCKNNCIWDNLQCCLLVPRSLSKPVMLTFDLQSRKV